MAGLRSGLGLPFWQSFMLFECYHVNRPDAQMSKESLQSQGLSF
jgi:hypothetical protein